jgi:hypothetical protein
MGHERDIERSRSAVEALRAKLKQESQRERSLEETVAEQQKQIVDLQLYLHALLRILVGKGMLTQGELAPFIGVIDAEEALAALFEGSKDGPARAVLNDTSPEELLLERLESHTGGTGV